MRVEGLRELSLPLELVWSNMLDRAILEQVTPGVSELLEVEVNHYEATSDIRLGPVRGRFKGSLIIHDIVEQQSFVLSLTQDSSIGSANADITVQLSANGDQTELRYSGDARLTGVLGRLGQRVLGGVVNSLAKQFFNDFEERVKTLTEEET
jgi:carbon monoxide dehydrogenase subunit G